MKGTTVAQTRSFALIGHTADGKTSLAEALLHAAGATPQLGSPADGTSVLDASPEEQERKHTLSSAIYSFDWNDHHLTLVDTPGDPNFQGDGQIALHGLDGAVLVVSAADGAKVGTESMWRASERANVPVIAFVNRLDGDRGDLDAAVESLKSLDIPAVKFAIPIGSGADLKGVVDLLTMKAVIGGKEQDIPADLADEAEAARSELVESAAESDDELLEKYLEEGELGDDDVMRGLLAGVHGRGVVPVLCGAAVGEHGTLTCLHAIPKLLPSPDQRPAWQATREGEPCEVSADPEGPFAATVIKTVIDRYAGTLSIFRVVSGTISHDTGILNATTGEKERLGKLLLLRGNEHVDTPDASPGDVVAVAKLKHVRTGAALTQEKGGVALAPIPIPSGALSYAISATSKGDEDKVFSSLGRLVEEDPTLQLGRDPSTGEFLLTGMGELHIRITAQKLKRLYEVEVELKTPKVPYRETIKTKAENVEGKLKKQTGGKGMFGVCFLSVEPRPRGEGLEFSDEIVGGAIPRNLIPAVEKGVLEASHAGPLAGYPVVDVRVRCIDGKHHSVDSNEMAFKLAGSFGFKAALEKAHPTLLEPIMQVEVSIPDDFVGDVMGDVSSRRGRVQTTESRGHTSVIKAEVPMAEMLEYASALTSLTGGKGAFHMEFDHYDEVPASEREKVIAEAKARAAEEG
ncbi:MAG: elongation factor G [Deltaproteobacteria bacterium]|nr:elongation factor G [Deltaproteobacteria bacterium]